MVDSSFDKIHMFGSGSGKLDFTSESESAWSINNTYEIVYQIIQTEMSGTKGFGITSELNLSNWKIHEILYINLNMSHFSPQALKYEIWTSSINQRWHLSNT